MENNRPRGREKNVTGPGKTVHKRGDGLGTGPVGDAGGYKDQKPSSGGASGTGTGAGGAPAALVCLLLLLLARGGRLGLFARLAPEQGHQPSAAAQQQGQHQRDQLARAASAGAAAAGSAA